MIKPNTVDRIETNEAPLPSGHYVQACAYKDLVFVSGQLPANPDGSSNADASFRVQAKRALDNIFAIVRAAGSAPDKIVKVTAYIVGIEHWPDFNALFADAFGEIRPARAVVPVPALHHGYLIELEAVAIRDVLNAPGDG